MSKPIIGVALGACVGVLLAGCSDSEAGNALPTSAGATTTGSTSSTRSGPSTHSPSSSVPSPLSGVEPCELLSNSDRQQLGLAQGKPTKIGQSTICQWSQSDVWGVAIGLKPDLAFKDANLRGATAQRIDIGRHEAYQVENAGNGKACEVFVVTNSSSFVQITVTYGTDVAKACGKAVPVAKIVDPKLP